MKICKTHWEKLRAAIDKRGLTPFVAKDGKAAVKDIATRLGGKDDVYVKTVVVRISLSETVR
jgi:hypothetical protein